MFLKQSLPNDLNTRRPIVDRTTVVEPISSEVRDVTFLKDIAQYPDNHMYERAQ